MLVIAVDIGEKSMLTKNFLYIGEPVYWWKQTLLCMLVNYVGENTFGENSTLQVNLYL